MKTLCNLVETRAQAACGRPARASRGKRKMGREEAKYWGLWSEIWNKFKVPSSERAQWRRELRREVLGSERTPASFTHGDYDVVLGAMRELLAQSQLVVFPEKIIWAYMEGEADASQNLSTISKCLRRILPLYPAINSAQPTGTACSRAK